MLFERRSLDEYTNSLADYLPGGVLFTSKSIQDSNFRKLLKGLAGEIFRANGSLREYDILPDQTEKFLSEWESTLGIPDECFSGAGTTEERRRDILVKLASLGVQTEQDFIELALLFGVDVELLAGADIGVFPYPFPITFFSSGKAARFTMVVVFPFLGAATFPLTFPFLFGNEIIAVLQCLFRKIAPANVNLIFRENPPPVVLPFVTTWNTEIIGDNSDSSPDDTITLHLGEGSFDFSIDWGDGIEEQIVSSGLEGVSHVYSSPGVYDVSITGLMPSLQFDYQIDSAKIVDVSSWGSIEFTSLEMGFAGCENLNISATDSPILGPNFNFSAAFADADLSVANIGGWDVSNVDNMIQMFNYSVNFNEDINSWDVSNVTNMSSMFNSSEAFNQDISSWDVSNVVDMGSMFSGADSFNQDISSWDVSSVTQMDAMFRFNDAFNQDISSWDVSSVTNMRFMFGSADTFDQNLGSWDVSSVANMVAMLDGSGLSQANYDATLIGWSGQAVQAGVSLGADGLFYTAATERAILTDPPNNWLISGDTLVVVGDQFFDDTYWDASGFLSWTGVYWDYTFFNGGITALVVDAINGGGWEVGYTPSQVEIEYFTGTAGSFPYPQLVELRDDLGGLIGSDTISFTAASQTVSHTISLDFTATGDISILRIQNLSFAQEGWRITNIVFS